MADELRKQVGREKFLDSVFFVELGDDCRVKSLFGKCKASDFLAEDDVDVFAELGIVEIRGF